MSHNSESDATASLNQHTINEPLSRVPSVNSKTSDPMSEKRAETGNTDQLSNDISETEPKWWQSKSLEHKPLDGWYAWGVVISGCFMLMFSMGCVNSYGTYQTYYHLHQFPDEPVSNLAWVGTLQFAVMNIFGIPAGVLCERMDTRLVTFIGGVIMAVSLIIASFCDSAPWKLILTQGIAFALGASLVFVPSTSIPSQWFTKRRALAVGIVVAGSGIGGLWLTPATQAMIDQLGTGWALRITGIILFVVNSISSLFMRGRIRVKSREKVVDLSIFRDMRFILICAGASCGTCGYFTPFFSMPSFAEEVVGKSSSFGNNLLTVINAASTVGRIATGEVAAAFGAINTMCMCTLVAGLSILVLWLPFETTGTLIACAIIYGMFCGGFIGLIPVVLAELWGVHRISTIIGLLYMANFVGTMVGAPSSSAILDSIGHGTNFKPTIAFSGTFMVCGGLFFFALRLATNKNLFKKV